MDSGDVPIFGPEQISIRECVEMMENTASACKFLISKSPSAVRGLLTFTIDQLAISAKGCCRAGGLWRGCFQKLANKYHAWNQKWQVFRMPPDPAWDD